MDFEKVAEELIKYSGGAGNISSVTHCMTRLRFIIKDTSKVDLKKINATKPVMGNVFKTNELQIILGQNLMPVYTAAAKLLQDQIPVEDMEASKPEARKKLTPGEAGTAVINFVSAAVTPLVPGLIAGGMLKVFLLLITLAVPEFSKSQTYTLLSLVANMPFYFMPVFVSMGTAKKLGSTPIYAMACSAALVAPAFTEMVSAGEAVHLFGLPVMLVKYNNTMMPALLIGICAAYVEKLMNKIIPGIFKSIFVGTGTLFITYTLGVTVLGPLGDFLGAIIVNVFVFSSEHFGFIALGALTAVLPWLIMTGMHHAISPFMTQFIADPGYDGVFRPAFILHNMAEGGSCLGVALKTKNKEFKAECFSLAVGCILAGVSEPAIYGIGVKYKKPMIGVMVGGAAGGVVAGLLGAKAFFMGYSTILALPIFVNTIGAMLAGIAVTIVAAAAVTYILGIEEESDADENADSDAPKELVSLTAEEEPQADPSVQGEKTQIGALIDGELIDITTVPDDMFAGKLLGDGVAFLSDADTVTVASPADGVLSAVYPTGHAFGITTASGVEMLVHIGIDTVKANGDGFTIGSFKQGEIVKKGDPIVTVDQKKLRDHYNLSIMLIVTNPQNHEITFKAPGTVKCGESILVPRLQNN